MEWPDTVCLLTVLLLLWRIFCAIRSRLGFREKQLSLQLADLLQDKCQLLDKVSRLQTGQEALEAALKEAREAKRWEMAQDRARLQGLIAVLLGELKEQHSAPFRNQQSRMAVISKRVRSLEEESESLTWKVAETKVALLRFNKARAQGARAEEEPIASVHHLQTQRTSGQSANSQQPSAPQKLQQRLTASFEVQHRVLSCHGKAGLQARSRAEQQLQERERAATEELETCRKLVRDLEEECERTVRFYQRQLTSVQREARENWVVAHNAEKELCNLRKENARTRQKLREMELKAPLSGKDPASLSVAESASSRWFSPRGPSRRCRPAPAKGSFPLLPTLWEEPGDCWTSSLAGPQSPPTAP
ncbi:Cutaneous T-cell lymphoma-associated antigen 5 [Fukomys damarensis]|uniref:Cutaneous T-cell lymphoma-associated antigen 5 n=1 Tax=Fukomys damarensis TaxID=885580 RepID=A0A091CR16_FUKDA|nr:Cutaneous T-cell lymphoma-associated antigen 5 [Fukomys damarensis]